MNCRSRSTLQAPASKKDQSPQSAQGVQGRDRPQLSLPALRLAHQKQTQVDHQHHRLANLRLARQDLSNHLLVESLPAHQETRSNLHPIREIVALALQSSVVQIALKEHQLLQM